ncbi:MAG: hypothetical protein H6559_09575 [Lewinellaceae bacterium]|nr:hypothetical protein [Lewinellaceae bacterium]
MLTSRASTSIEPAHLPFLANPGAAPLLTGCRLWQGQALGAASGSAVFDSCSLGAVSITGQQPLSSYITDDYFLVFADMCGDGEIIIQINAAPANGGWAGMEVREDTASGARKFGLRTQTGAVVQPSSDSTLSAEPGDSIQICVDISNPRACSPVSADVALASSSAPHLSGYVTQSLAFTGGSAGSALRLRWRIRPQRRLMRSACRM